jgi:RNA polymerase sigma factor (sigma-70 family)
MTREEKQNGPVPAGGDLRPPDSALGDGRFPNTRWSVVLAIQEHGDGAAAEALSELCRIYWYPLYAFVRRRGKSPHEAEDLTQEFFARLFEKDSLESVRREKGKLRSFLLTVMKRFLANEYERANAQKRGGGKVPVPIDQDWAEERYHHEPADETTPEDHFERQWALTLLDNVLAQLRREFVAKEKAAQYEALKETLLGNPDHVPYAAIAERLGTTEGAVKTAVHRMRARYRELLHHEIERTVDSPEEINEEIQHLFTVRNMLIYHLWHNLWIITTPA